MSLVIVVSCRLSVRCGAARGLPQLRGRNALPAKGKIGGTVRRQMFDPLFRLDQGWPMTGQNPPHDRMRTIQLVEPFLTPAVEALVDGLPDETLERLDAFPYRQIDRHLRVGERPEIRGVAAVVLEPPDKTSAALGEA